METKTCRHCQSEINAKATTCPACGKGQSDWPVVVAAVIVGLPVCMCLLMMFLGSLSG